MVAEIDSVYVVTMTKPHFWVEQAFATQELAEFYLKSRGFIQEGHGNIVSQYWLNDSEFSPFSEAKVFSILFDSFIEFNGSHLSHYKKFTVKDLKRTCKNKGLLNYSKLTKTELINKILEFDYNELFPKHTPTTFDQRQKCIGRK